MDRVEFPKMPRLAKTDCYIVEKIDGTNASVYIDEYGCLTKIASRNRFITPEDDNFGFAKWVTENKAELEKLGPGIHFGEWYGLGIQRGYGLNERRFALFNYWSRKADNTPDCCEVLYPVAVVDNIFKLSERFNGVVDYMEKMGSYQVPGYMQPEGVVIKIPALKASIKWTFEHQEGKWKNG